MDAFTSEELAAWATEEYNAIAHRWGTNYELQPGEITAAMFAEQADNSLETARRKLNRLAQMGRMERRYEVIDGNRVVIYKRVTE